MNQSEQINELVKALAIAQGSFKRVGYDKNNPHYKSKYASLEAIIDATRDQLAKNGLCVVHIIEGERLESRLLHTSGQWMASSIPLFLDKRSPQAVGSALTYARRYNMCCLLNINAGEDDDAEVAEKEHVEPPRVTMVISDEQVDQLEGLLAEYPYLRKGILKTYSLEGFETLPANMFQSVVKKINVSIEAKRKTA
mgnify:CR=1 FL=1